MAILYIGNPVVAGRYYDLFMPEDGNFESLEPREDVPGSGSYEIPAATVPTISQQALEDMQAYAADQDSWALLVIQNGELQHEWYAPGWDRERFAQKQGEHNPNRS